MRSVDTKITELLVKQWAIAVLIDEGLIRSSDQLDVGFQYRIEYLARQISLVLKLPCQELADESVVAEWPSTLWDHIKKTLGLRYRKHQLLHSETLVFPDIDIPAHLGKVRVYTYDRLAQV